jgi:hypothetical protein
MTYKEFKREVFAIYNQPFAGDDKNPIEYGIQRAGFEEKKLRRLIGLAEQTDFSTAKRKVAGWRRQLERVQRIKTRLELRRKEAPVGFTPGKRPPSAVPLPLIANRTTRPIATAR